MKSKMWRKVGAFILIVGGLVAVLWPVQTWRMYDANWRPLAMTHAESYCAGTTLAEGDFINRPYPNEMKDCLKDSKLDNTIPNIGKAVNWACRGIQAVNGWMILLCEATVEAYGLWFLTEGGYTFEWDDVNHRPEAYRFNIKTAPPRDQRDIDERDSGGRLTQ